MSIEAMKQVIEAFDALPPDHPARYANLQINALRAALSQQPATGEPVAYVDRDGFIIETGLLLTPGTKLYTHPAPSAPDDVVRDAISTVREYYRGTDWGKAAESICDAIDAAMLHTPQPSTITRTERQP